MISLLRGDLYRLGRELKLWLSLGAVAVLTNAAFLAFPQVAPLMSCGVAVSVVAVLSAAVVGEDFETGFVKGVFVALDRRSTYVYEKFLLFALLGVLFVLWGFAMALLSSLVLGGGIPLAASVLEVLEWSLVLWFLAAGLTAVVVAFVFLVRNELAGVVMSLLLSVLAVEALIAAGEDAVMENAPVIILVSCAAVASSHAISVMAANRAEC